ncbi:MAG: hypothetical protein ABSE73_25165 [Planctomycetota bacterium]|jgi:hypothetical protein
MTRNTDKKAEIRKDWVAPELRKTSIEQITATSRGRMNNDGGTKPNDHDS